MREVAVRLAAFALVVAAAQQQDASDAFFGKGEIPRLRIELAAEEEAKLRADPRAYVRAKLTENEKIVYEDVAVKLKGAAGSFQELDDKPAFTLNVDKFKKGQLFHGLEKLHLNNSVQDATYLQEQLGSELCNAAGVATPRVTHARVWLGERDLGFYVVKEGFDRRFLARHFEDPKGNLYDGGFCNDVDADLERDEGKGPDDHRDLHALVEACRESDPALRFEKLAAKVAIDEFVTFVALELSLGHWDGYSLNRNNYRLYVDPAGRAHFLPHGMDQIFQDPDAPVLDYPNALVAEAVMRNPTWRAQFRKKLTELLPRFSARTLVPRVEALADRLRPALKTTGGDAARDHDAAVRDLEARLAAREKSLKEQAKRPEPKTLEFDPKGSARLAGWNASVEAGEPLVEQKTFGGKRVLAVETKEPCVASWRRRVMLARGRYRLEANVRTRGVAPLEGEEAGGVVLRTDTGAGGGMVASSDAWTPTSIEFDVLEASRLVELVLETRTARGYAWLELSSLRLVKVFG
jgi:hypothetical protein